MKKNVLVYGLISGTFIAAWCVCSVAYCYSTNKFEGSMLLGYTAMLLAFSLVFVGVKSYRDKYNGGVISFGKAFRLGLYITLIASTIYVIAWVIDYYVFIPDFMDKFGTHAIDQLKNNGATAAEIAAKTKEINTMKQMYDTPVGVVLLTYLEIFPIGLIVTIITALILKRKANNDNAVAVNNVRSV